MARSWIWAALAMAPGCTQVFGLDSPNLGGPSGFVQQSAGKQSGGTSATAKFASAATAGDLVVAAISTDTNIGQIQSVTGVSDAWMQIAAVPGTGASCSGCIRGAMWYGFASGNGDSAVTVQVDASDDFVVSVSEWTGVVALDLSATAGPDTTITVSSGSVATAVANDLVLAMGAWDQAKTSGGPTGGFVALDQVHESVAFVAPAWRVLGQQGSANATWQLSATTQSWIGIAAAFSRM